MAGCFGGYSSGFAIRVVDEVGGVGGPVSAGGVDPGDGGGGVEIEEVGEDGGGEPAGEVEEG